MIEPCKRLAGYLNDVLADHQGSSMSPMCCKAYMHPAHSRETSCETPNCCVNQTTQQRKYR